MSSVREQGKARRKASIIQAAKNLLAQGGIDALSTRKLAEEAGLSVHTLYALVGSKEEILEAVMEDNHNRVLSDILKINEEHPIDRIFAIVTSTYNIIAEDSAAQRALMRVLMTLYYEGNLNPRPWWLLAQENGWMVSAVAEAIRQKLLRADFAASIVADMLMKIYLANLREYLFDQVDLETFRDATIAEFRLCLLGIVTDDHRRISLKRAKAAAKARLMANNLRA